MVKKAVDTNKSSREELFRAFQLFGMSKSSVSIEYSHPNRSRSKWFYYHGRTSHGWGTTIVPYWLSFIQVLHATGDHPTDEDALEMIAEADIDGDGRSNGRQTSISPSSRLPSSKLRWIRSNHEQ